MTSESCIVAQFSRLSQLSEQEKELLQSLERDVHHYPAGEALCAAGSEALCFFSLNSGWACATRVMADGQRQVLDIFLAGQVMGLREIGFDRAQSELVALTDVAACPFPRHRLGEIFHLAPRLADLFFLVLAREHALLTERIINIGRRPAIERLAHFLLEMKTRLHVDTHEFELPMNQTVIGDALGLSAVHISRTLAQLKEQNLVNMEHGQVSIRNLEGLIELAGFDRAYLDFGSNWARIDPPVGIDLKPVADAP